MFCCYPEQTAWLYGMGLALFSLGAAKKKIAALEARLRAVSERSDLLDEASGIGLWEAIMPNADPVHPEAQWTWSAEFRRLCGYRTEADYPNVMESWSNRLHPDDAPHVFAAFGGHLEDKTGKTLAENFNLSMVHLEETMGSIAANAEGVHLTAAEVTRASDNLSQRTEQQAATLEQTAAALDEITATVRKTAEGASEARRLVADAKQDAESSTNVVHETVTAVNGIEQSSRQISNIIGVIDEIAFQTNLLALNAGVEAARAVAAGRRVHAR